MFRRLAALAAACGLLLAGPAFAGPASSVVLAHAELSAAIPGIGEVVPEAPTQLQLAFSEPFEPELTSASVLDPQGAVILSGAGGPDPDDPYSLIVDLPDGLVDGIYTVRWTAVSSADGHSTGGRYTFGIGDVAPPPVDVDEGGGSLHAGHGAGLVILETESRALSYLGFLLAAGLPVIGWLVLRRPTSARVLAAAFAAALAGSVGVLVVSAVSAGVSPLEYATAGRSGLLFSLRIAIAIVGLVAVWLAGRVARPAVPPAIGVVIAYAGLVAIAFGGHASAYASPAPIAAVIVHVGAVSIWLSGVATLAWLAISKGDAPASMSELVPRFSALALCSIGIVVLTGVYSDWVQTRDLLDFSTPYSVALLLKLGLAVATIGVGAFNYVDGGRDRPRFGSFRGRVSVEILLAVAVVLATGNLTSGSPPAQSRPAELAPAASTATGLGSTSLAMEPGRPGPNRFIAELDPAIVAAEVRLAVQQFGTTSEATPYPMRAVQSDGGTVYVVDGTLVRPETRWSISVIGLDDGGVEVGRTRFELEMGEDGVASGLAAPPLDPAVVVAFLLLIGALLLGVFALAGGVLPRTDPRTSRLASVAASAAGATLGVIILFTGQL